MNKPDKKLLIFVLIAVFLTAPAAWAEGESGPSPTENPFLWVIQADPPSFLYGTIHLPDDQVLVLPRVVDTAFEASDVVCTEIPMDTETMMKAAMAFMLPGEETLADILPEDLYRRTDEVFKSKGFSLQMFQKFSVIGVAIQIPLLDYLPEMATKQPLDMTLYQRALSDGKEMDALETIEEQIAVFQAFSTDEQIHILRTALDWLDKTADDEKPAMERLIEAYLDGDAKKFWDLAYEYYDPNDPVDNKFLRIAISERNQRMADRIVERLREESGKIRFFAVGAGHYHRDDGVLALLREAGFKVERLSADDADKLEEILAADAAVDD